MDATEQNMLIRGKVYTLYSLVKRTRRIGGNEERKQGGKEGNEDWGKRIKGGTEKMRYRGKEERS